MIKERGQLRLTSFLTSPPMYYSKVVNPILHQVDDLQID